MNCNVPIPLDDELAVTLLGRFAQLNGISSHQWAIRSMKSYFPDQAESSALALLSALCGVKKDEFAAAHSMLPVLYPTSGYIGSERGESNRRHLTATYGLNVPTGTLRWCPECARKDIEERGFSHWRRKHHVAGIDWCVEHRTPLLSAIDAIQANVTALRDDRLTVAIKLGAEELGSPALLRLEGVLIAWLLQPQPVRLQAWSEVIGQRCRLLGLRVGEIGKREVVSDWIQEQFPKSWLIRHMPEIAGKAQRNYVRKVDGACVDKHLSYPGLACAAIVAVLFDSAEEGLLALREADRRIAELVSPAQQESDAIAAFLAGMNLQQACANAGVGLREVEAKLRNRLNENSLLESAPIAPHRQ